MTTLCEWHDLSVVEQAERLLCERDSRFRRSVRCYTVDGALVLAGRVPTWHVKQLAQKIAAEIDGVERIDNQIEVFCDPGNASRASRVGTR